MIIENAFTNTQNSIQDKFLEILCTTNSPTKIFLRNGIALEGYIESFDHEVIILKNDDDQLIYKSSIATIMPTFGIKKIARQRLIIKHSCV